MQGIGLCANAARARAFGAQIADRDAVHRIPGAVDIRRPVAIPIRIVSGCDHTGHSCGIYKIVQISVHISIRLRTEHHKADIDYLCTAIMQSM